MTWRGAHGLAVARGRLRKRLEAAWSTNFRCAADERLACLWNQRERRMLLSFLERPEIGAADWPAEQPLRPFVVAPRVWGDRRPNGTRTQRALGSVIQNCSAASTLARRLASSSAGFPLANRKRISDSAASRAVKDKPNAVSGPLPAFADPASSFGLGLFQVSS